MPVYKYTYFNLRAKGEVVRLLFAVAGVQYEDIRIELDAWFQNPSLKENLPFGQLPTLSVDGQLYCQSVSIARYLAEKFGLAGHTDEDKLRADMIVHCVDDILRYIVDILHEKDPPTKEKLLKKFKEEQLPQSCGHFEKFLQQNKGGDGYLVGDAMAGMESKDFIDAYPKLKGLVDRVGKQPGIAAWIAKRPVTAV